MLFGKFYNIRQHSDLYDNIRQYFDYMSTLGKHTSKRTRKKPRESSEQREQYSINSLPI